MEDPQVYLVDIYDPRRRIDRLNFRYLFVLIALSPGFIAMISAMLMQGYTDDNKQLITGEVASEIYWRIFMILGWIVSYFVLVILINRMRDTGKPFYYLLIPGYNLYILFIHPTKCS